MNQEILAIIPARSGSKGIPHKNIYNFNGKPLIAHSIEQACNCSEINRVIVSTDSEEYIEISKKYGAEAPFIRPQSIANDSSTDFEVFEHALNYLVEKEKYRPDIIVHLRPTYPTRRIVDIKNAIKMLSKDKSLDSVRSIVESIETPYKMWLIENEYELKNIISNGKESYNMPRQSLPKTYIQNACIDVVRFETIMLKHSMTGNKIGGYIMDKNEDIDTLIELHNIQTESSLIIPENKRFCFDIDGVIASITPENDYGASLPIKENINIINKLYEKNHIILFTARGYITKKNWENTTKSQLKKWKVKYHELKFGKPAADFYIDDRMIGIEKILKWK